MKVYNGFTGDKSMSDHFTSKVVYNVIEDGNVICINGTADDIISQCIRIYTVIHNRQLRNYSASKLSAHRGMHTLL